MAGPGWELTRDNIEGNVRSSNILDSNVSVSWYLIKSDVL